MMTNKQREILSQIKERMGARAVELRTDEFKRSIEFIESELNQDRGFIATKLIGEYFENGIYAVNKYLDGIRERYAASRISAKEDADLILLEGSLMSDARNLINIKGEVYFQDLLKNNGLLK